MEVAIEGPRSQEQGLIGSNPNIETSTILFNVHLEVTAYSLCIDLCVLLVLATL
ncbi:MAG: hypothetical protein MJE68_25690 [Proteobacteria bacterium]|nr:hypothetical protein [Pseudomonadota bacterium]